MPVYLTSYAKRMLYSEQPTFLLARGHLNTMILTNFENLNSISNIFQETHDFLVLTDPVIICIYLRTTNRHFRDQGNVRHPNSKLLKHDLVQTLNTFQNPSLRIFAVGKASLVNYLENISTVTLTNKHMKSCEENSSTFKKIDTWCSLEGGTGGGGGVPPVGLFYLLSAFWDFDETLP